MTPKRNKKTGLLFNLGTTVKNKETKEVFYVVGTPQSYLIEKTNEGAYAIRGDDAMTHVISQEEMEKEGCFEVIPSPKEK